MVPAFTVISDDTGRSSSDEVTNDTQLVLNGTAEPNEETGSAWTLAALLQPGERWRVGVEYLDVRAARPAAAAAGASPDTDARRLQVELRLLF